MDINKSKKNIDIKICLAASAGGHLVQLLKISSCWQNYERFFVTTSDAVADKLQKEGSVYVVGECNREHPLEVIRVFLRCFKIITNQKPTIIISTGAACGCMLAFIGKLYKAKVIWLDSIANTEKLSLSGRLIRPFADLILTQWQDVAEKYKNVKYEGSVV